MVVDRTHRQAEPGGCEVAVDSVSKTFGDITVLRDIRFTIRPGEFFTLLGPSGCGKTTLLRAIAGFHPISGGRILFDGRDVTTLPPWERTIGFVFQNYALWPNKTVYDNVAYGLKLRKVPKASVRDRVHAALAQVQLHGVEKRYPAEMSGGMQQRIALARALVIDPPLLLLDEPMSNLDARLRVSLRQELREIQKRLGLTAIYVTHDQEEALEMSDRIAVMNGGVVQQLADPETIYARPANRFVAEFVGSANFLEGTTRGGTFHLANGCRIPTAENELDGHGTLFVRPECVEVLEAGQGQFDAMIVDRRYMGKTWTQTLQCSDGSLVFAETRGALDLGRQVGVSFDRPTILPAEAR